MDNVVIRKMELPDCEQVYALECACFGAGGWQLTDYQETVNMDNHICYVAEQAGSIVGFALVIVMVDTADLINIAVAKDYRGQGISKLLMKQLDVEAKRLSLVNVTLEVRASNQVAISLYEKFGFVKISVRKQYYSNPTEDADIMQKQYDIL